VRIKSFFTKNRKEAKEGRRLFDGSRQDYRIALLIFQALGSTMLRGLGAVAGCDANLIRKTGPRARALAGQKNPAKQKGTKERWSSCCAT